MSEKYAPPPGSDKTAVEQYDSAHGKYATNVPEGTVVENLPNTKPSGPDPSPFKVGPT